jgi:aspartate kinase
MIVMKFGGTSIQDAACIRRVTEIIRSRLDLKPILIFSALGKTTRNLLHTAEMAAQGQYIQAREKLKDICQYHLSLLKEVCPERNHRKAENLLARYCQEIDGKLHAISADQTVSPNRQDHVLSYGELMATVLLADVLSEQNIPAVWMDARSFIITDDSFTKAHPIRELTDKKICSQIKPHVKKGKVPVIQGFIGSTENGETTTLGFEGSDFTASLVGSALDVSDIQIWKDVPGIMTADPAVILHPYMVTKISFAEAEKLTRAGAKILHPDTLAPAREKAIPVHITNSRRPDEQGTVISLQSSPCTNPVKSITCKTGRCIIRLQCRDKDQKDILIQDTRKFFNNAGIHALFFTDSESAVIVSIDDTDRSDLLLKNLNRLGEFQINQNKATIALVGMKISAIDGFQESLLSSLNGQPVEEKGFTDSGDMFILVINPEDTAELISRLHDTLFRQRDPDFFK